MQTWMRAAPDKSACRGRRAIRLSRADWLLACKAAELYRACSQAVWLGISEYNHQGPEGLERQGRQRRREACLALEQGEAFLRQRLSRAEEGLRLSAGESLSQFEQRLLRRVSVEHVYHRLSRWGWARPGLQPRHPLVRPRDRDRLEKKLPG